MNLLAEQEDWQMAGVTQDSTWKRVVFDVRWADTAKMTAGFGTCDSSTPASYRMASVEYICVHILDLKLN